MSDQRNGGIAWTEQTWNPLRGCSRVSAGCVNCYAEAMAARFCGPGQPYEGTINPETKRWTGKIKLVPEKLDEPLRWTRPRRVFVNSMSDLFHPDVPDEFIDQVFAVMALAPQHTFQVLTKRPERMREYLSGAWQWRMHDAMRKVLRTDKAQILETKNGSLPNVWLGITVENQEAADERIPLLLQTPAAVRWVSAEPLLGPVNLRRYMWPVHPHWPAQYRSPNEAEAAGAKVEYKRQALVGAGCVFLDWVVAGGESGPHARPMHPDWARGLRDQCADAGVPFLFKQWGEYGTAYQNGAGEQVFRQFSSFEQWVNKASSWVRGGSCLDTAGRELKNGADMKRASDDGKFPVTIMHRVGKKAAGRLLDGVLHDEFPKEKA